MKSKRSFWIFVVIISIVIISFFLRANIKPYEKRSKFLLGTVVEVTANEDEAFDIVFNEISRIENLLSKYKLESEIYKLNLYGSLKVSNETKEIIEQAKKFFYESAGAFDITVAPVVDLWKEAIKRKILPDKKSLARTKKLIGSEKIIIDEKTSQVKFLKQAMEIDLGGIAKGYAVDCAVRKLRQQRIKSCLINAGGQIYCLGRKAGQLWRIGIQHPRSPNKFIKYLELENKAVATSGDYEQYFIIDNKRYSHIIDPKTAYPAQTDILSVTVISDDGTTADALSTAIFVLGEEKGLELANRYKDTKVIIFTPLENSLTRLTDEDLDVPDN